MNILSPSSSLASRSYCSKLTLYKDSLMEEKRTLQSRFSGVKILAPGGDRIRTVSFPGRMLRHYTLTLFNRMQHLQ